METYRHLRRDQAIISPGYVREGRAPSRPPSHGFSNQTPRVRSAKYTPRLFALIIGINGYVNSRALRGAVSDAKSMKQFLKDHMGVPEDRIRTLLDQRATRQAIIRAFEDLESNPRIKPGDPIVIFFAGHGGEARPPRCWDIKGTVQCLIPYDHQASNAPPIPDRTIASLIDDIAQAKGSNITLIFDCCYSAGCARLDHGKEYIPRAVEINAELPKDLDNDIWGGRTGNIPQGFAHKGVRSHVLLAACGERDLAFEHEGRGQFTCALLETLKKHVFTETTYAEVIQHIIVDRQSPQCIGVNQNSRLFDMGTPVHRPIRYSIRIIDCGRCIIYAGMAHGVRYGVEFTLYTAQSQELGSVVVANGTAELREFCTILAIPATQRPDMSFARLTRVGHVTFSLAPEQRFSSQVFQHMHGNGPRWPNFHIIERRPETMLEIVMANRRIAFRILDRRVREFGLTRLPHTVTVDAVARVLSAAAHYYWYLYAVNRECPSITNREVIIDFYRLSRGHDELGLPIYLPASQGLRRQNPRDHSDVIDLVADPGVIYGIEIKNRTSRGLYLNAFLFNNSSLSIAPYYIQSSAGNPDAPLKRNETFTIGFGPGGTAPFTYSLAKGQSVDVGYLKIFFATRAIDLTDIVQKSPFEEPDPPPMVDSREGGPMLETRGINDSWFTVTVPVVQRRR